MRIICRYDEKQKKPGGVQTPMPLSPCVISCQCPPFDFSQSHGLRKLTTNSTAGQVFPLCPVVSDRLFDSGARPSVTLLLSPYAHINTLTGRSRLWTHSVELFAFSAVEFTIFAGSNGSATPKLRKNVFHPPKSGRGSPLPSSTARHDFDLSCARDARRSRDGDQDSCSAARESGR